MLFIFSSTVAIYCNLLEICVTVLTHSMPLVSFYMRQLIFVLTHFIPLVTLYSLKTSENHWFSDVFKGIERDKSHKMG